MTYNLLKFGHILGAILMGAGLVGVWMADLRSRQLRDLRQFAEAVRNIAVFYDGLVVPGALILLASGWRAEDIAEALLVDPNTVRTHFKRYRGGGLEEAGLAIAVIAEDDVPVALSVVACGDVAQVKLDVFEALQVLQADGLEVHA